MLQAGVDAATLIAALLDPGTGLAARRRENGIGAGAAAHRNGASLVTS